MGGRDEHAVVVGASVAGLLAARVLAEAYERVTVVERDRLPAVGDGRQAVPQGRHVHALLASGQRCIDELLPGFSDQLLAAGAVHCTGMREMRIVVAGHQLVRDAVTASCVLASRPLIEGHIRRRVLALPNVTTLEQTAVTGLIASPDRDRVVGVQVRRGPGGADDRLDATLVVAASGRGGGVPGWLARLGHPGPSEERLAVDLVYASQPLRLPPGALDSDKLILIGARPELPRGMGLFAQEHGRRLLTLAGYGPDHRPPTDRAGYLAFAATVAPDDVLAAIRDAQPLAEIATHRFPANRRRRYERLRRFPEGLLVIGDAIASFNPLYGQGMSVAALEAIELRRCLAEGRRRLAQRFLRGAARIVDPAWQMAVDGDLALPVVAGHRSITTRIGNAYTERLLQAAERDPHVTAAFSAVADLLEPPAHVMRPTIAWRVLRRRPAPGPPPASRASAATATGRDTAR